MARFEQKSGKKFRPDGFSVHAASRLTGSRGSCPGTSASRSGSPAFGNVLTIAGDGGDHILCRMEADMDEEGLKQSLDEILSRLEKILELLENFGEPAVWDD